MNIRKIFLFQVNILFSVPVFLVDLVGAWVFLGGRCSGASV